MQQGFVDRSISALATAIVIGLLGLALVLGLDVRLGPVKDETLTLITPTPPRPPALPRPKPHPRMARAKSGKASPPNLRSKATEIVAPPPLIVPPLPVPIVAALKAGPGVQSRNGASSRIGPGEGAGGEGNGYGSGGSGDGDGDGSGGDIPPRQIKGRLKFSDMPLSLREAGAGGTVSVRYHVQVSGRASDCVVTRSSGYRALDALTCELLEERFRFRPSRDETGQPVRSLIEESYSWITEPARPDLNDDD